MGQQMANFAYAKPASNYLFKVKYWIVWSKKVTIYLIWSTEIKKKTKIYFFYVIGWNGEDNQVLKCSETR